MTMMVLTKKGHQFPSIYSAVPVPSFLTTHLNPHFNYYLTLSQHTLKHTKGLFTVGTPLLIVDVAGEFIASCAVVHLLGCRYRVLRLPLEQVICSTAYLFN